MDWAGGGGGFMNDSIAEEPQQLSNNVSVGQEERSKTIASVSVSVISKLTRPNDGLIIHKKKIHHVVLIAYIYEVLDITPSKVHILVDDYTAGGPLEVSHVIGDSGHPNEDSSMFDEDIIDVGAEPKSNKDLSTLQAGDYIRCIGVVKYNQDSPNVVAYHLRYVDDPNEITNHILEVISDNMKLETLSRSSNGMNPNGAVATTGAAGAKYQTNNDNNSEFGHLATREKFVLKYVRDKTDEINDKGASVDDIVKEIKAFSRAEILDSLHLLNGEGLCWQGDDENTWFANK